MPRGIRRDVVVVVVVVVRVHGLPVYCRNSRPPFHELTVPQQRATQSFSFLREYATRWDLLALLITGALVAALAQSSRGLLAPLAQLDSTPLSLAPAHLPEYAARTTLRMFAALAASLLFTLTYATWAARSERAARLLIPLLDILQSVPILGFISVTVVFFMSLVPGRVLGAELAAVFAIFTSQAWNMAFSFYQSLRTVPAELTEAADSFHLTPWMRFWQLEVPFAMPALVWNMMMSMSGGWFFVVASESISVGNTTVALPGIGSYIALAIAQRNLTAICWAIGAMLIVILIYDQLLFRPLIAWVDRFKVEQDANSQAPDSWALTMMRRSRLIAGLTMLFYTLIRWTSWALQDPQLGLPVLGLRHPPGWSAQGSVTWVPEHNESPEHHWFQVTDPDRVAMVQGWPRFDFTWPGGAPGQPNGRGRTYLPPDRLA